MSTVLKTTVDEAALRTTDELGVHLTQDLVDQAEQGAQKAVGIKTRHPLLRFIAGCTCFVAGTKVATASGNVSIEKLRAGEKVLAENPLTGKVELEPVRTVIADHVSPLIAVYLHDGTILKVTVDHPFWVDKGQRLSNPGWLPAGQLRPGDVLRTVRGRGIAVVAVRRNMGRAVVYSITVAQDHTFFVGTARVLVHNADFCPRPPWKPFPNLSDVPNVVLNKLELFRGGDGEFYTGEPRFEPSDTIVNIGPVRDGRYIYAISTDGQILVAPEDAAAQLGAKHSNLLAGADAYYAGTMEFSGGRMISWSNISGHYKPIGSLHNQVQQIYQFAGQYRGT